MNVFQCTHGVTHLWIHTHTHPIHISVSFWRNLALFVYHLSHCWLLNEHKWEIHKNLTKSTTYQIQLIKTHLSKEIPGKKKNSLEWEQISYGKAWGGGTFLSILKLFIYGNFYFWTKVMNEYATKSWWHQPHHYSFEKFLSKCNHCPILKLKIEMKLFQI